MNAPAAEPPVLTAVEDGVMRLTMNRGAARNALSLSMMQALVDGLAAAAADKTVRVVILDAKGPAFCAGHDLKEMTAHRADPDKGKAFYDETFALCSKLMQAIVHHPRPVIAQVHGIATAAGCQLVASCDMAVASHSARFATPGVNIGLFCSTPMVALSRNVSRKHAMEMLLTGELISADEAFRMGLINRAVPEEVLQPATGALAALIASKPRRTLKIGKEAFYRQAEMPLAEAYDYTARVMVENMLEAEAAEGIGAFVEKREPKWPDKD